MKYLRPEIITESVAYEKQICLISHRSSSKRIEYSTNIIFEFLCAGFTCFLKHGKLYWHSSEGYHPSSWIGLVTTAYILKRRWGWHAKRPLVPSSYLIRKWWRIQSGERETVCKIYVRHYFLVEQLFINLQIIIKVRHFVILKCGKLHLLIKCWLCSKNRFEVIFEDTHQLS